MRRLVILARAARKQGKFDFSIGGLVLEISQPVVEENSKNKNPLAWIEIVIAQIKMEEIIDDDTIKRLKDRLLEIESKAKQHA